MIGHIFGLLFSPKRQWQAIAEQETFSLAKAVLYAMLLAVIPAVAWYYGVTDIGWSVGDGDTVRMTSESALAIIVLFYLTMILSVIGIGFMIHWMATTYGAESSTAKGIAITGFAATPLFVAGAVGFLPVFWLALSIAIAAVCYAVYLLYLGIPAVMHIPEERGFLFASAVLAVCMVVLMMIMGGTVILWDMGAAPEFID
ncbi:MAG: Yip1 family protein [Pseudomonadales bacterium]